MGTGSSADAIAFPAGRKKRPDAERSLVTDGSFHAAILENQKEPTDGPTNAKKPRGGDLAGGCGADAALVEVSETRPGNPGQLAVLVVASAASDAALHGEAEATGDWRAIRPGDLTSLLNSTAAGRVISERQLYRHRRNAGLCGRRVDFFRYVAWLLGTYQELKAHTHEDLSMRGILKLVERQEYRCALTGRELTPKTAALDHIIPSSRGGADTLANAQVLHKQVNRAKGTLTNEEFLELCREVVTHAGYEVRQAS